MTPKLDKPFHAEKGTLGSNETSPLAKEIVESLHDVLKCEEMWFIAEKHVEKVKKTVEDQYASILADSRRELEGLREKLVG